MVLESFQISLRNASGGLRPVELWGAESAVSELRGSCQSRGHQAEHPRRLSTPPRSLTGTGKKLGHALLVTNPTNTPLRSPLSSDLELLYLIQKLLGLSRREVLSHWLQDGVEEQQMKDAK